MEVDSLRCPELEIRLDVDCCAEMTSVYTITDLLAQSTGIEIGANN